MEIIETDGGGEFRFPSEFITGRNPLLHRDPLEAHTDEIRNARADAAERNKQFSQTTTNNKKS
jgi:hypothetical protein